MLDLIASLGDLLPSTRSALKILFPTAPKDTSPEYEGQRFVSTLELDVSHQVDHDRGLAGCRNTTALKPSCDLPISLQSPRGSAS